MVRDEAQSECHMTSQNVRIDAYCPGEPVVAVHVLCRVLVLELMVKLVLSTAEGAEMFYRKQDSRAQMPVCESCALAWRCAFDWSWPSGNVA